MSSNWQRNPIAHHGRETSPLPHHTLIRLVAAGGEPPFQWWLTSQIAPVTIAPPAAVAMPRTMPTVIVLTIRRTI